MSAQLLQTALGISPPEPRKDRMILYLHGGGQMTSRFSRTVTSACEFRRQPEHSSCKLTID